MNSHLTTTRSTLGSTLVSRSAMERAWLNAVRQQIDHDLAVEGLAEAVIR